MNQPSQNLPTPNINTTEAGAGATTLVAGPDLANNQVKKKRKANASGPRIISFTVIPNHKGDTVGKKIEEVLKDWGIRNVSTITVDSASSNDVAVAFLKKKINNMDGLMGDGEHFHMRGAAHINLAISSIRNVVRFVKSSPHRAAKFRECVQLAGISCKKLLSLDVSTRWNSTYLMLEAVEKFQVAFGKLEVEESSYKDFFGEVSPPTSYDWDIARAFATFLKLFYEATRVFSSSQHESIHAAFHQLSTIYCELQNASLNLNTIFASVVEDMLAKYDKYWANKDSRWIIAMKVDIEALKRESH
ncbi:zinc finger BED domain-containing protein RICESLEEPER 2-like [Cicer arietinum]|uniref:zinc finger BED domain-containing protein RICESLEEPER 2-like n=1 Tax=Cicer arietinum TaxID=3827 RepID=UPI003CC61982